MRAWLWIEAIVMTVLVYSFLIGLAAVCFWLGYNIFWFAYVSGVLLVFLLIDDVFYVVSGKHLHSMIM